jgi:CBS domain-containing protein
LGELGLATKPVVKVLDTDSTLDAFRTMNTRHISGLAIVNSSGVIVGNTSASDLKLFIAKPSFRLLRMAVFQYLNIIRRSVIKEGAPVVSVHASDTLGKAIAKLSATAMHRIFVVDEHNKPIGVVSLSDILHQAVTPVVLPALPPASPSLSPATPHPAAAAPAVAV